MAIVVKQTPYQTQSGKTIIVLTPTGRLDITTASQFRSKLQDCIAKVSPNVVINLSQVSFIDSSGLAVLVAGMRDADQGKGSFRLCDVHPEAKLVFEVTMMDSVFQIFNTEAEALQEVLAA
jgi:anti-anti-sigma factor